MWVAYLRILHAVSTAPLTGPNLWMASMPYSEQVGMKRHAGGSRGEMNAL